MAEPTAPARPTCCKIESMDSSGHFWMIQQGKEFYIEENAGRPDLGVEKGDKRKRNRGAGRDGPTFDKLAARLVEKEGLTARQ